MGLTALTVVALQSQIAAESAEIPFRDVTSESGIDFEHDNGARGKKLLPEAYGSGVLVFDFDRDGAVDLLFVNGAAWNDDDEERSVSPALELYVNDGSGRFTETEAFEDLPMRLHGMGASTADFDQDGWTDLYVTCVGPNLLFRNHEGLHFEDWTERAGVSGGTDEWSTSSCWFDLENDGDADLFVANYVDWSPETDGRLDCRLDGGPRAYCHPEFFGGTHPRMYRNDGEGRFADVSAETGVRVSSRDSDLPVGRSLSATAADVNADGWADVLVSNDGGRNLLLLNNRSGGFDEVGIDWGIAFDDAGRSRRATGIDAGVFRDDGSLQVLLGGVAHHPSRIYRRLSGRMLFTEDSVVTGVAPQTQTAFTFGAVFIDADLDGRLDILTVNGHVESEIDVLQPAQTYRQSPLLLWNSGRRNTREFVRLSDEQCRDLMDPLVGRGAAFADFDADGDLDLVLTANGGRARLLRNEQTTGHHWLRVKLEGTRCHADAIGARVSIESGGRTLVRQVRPVRGYLSQSEATVTFGLGGEDDVARLRVDWPGGGATELTDVSVDTTIVITQE